MRCASKIAAMAKVPPMQFRSRRLVFAVAAGMFALQLGIGEVLGDVWFDRVRVLGPWWWLYRAVLALALLFFAYRTWRPPVRVSFADDGLVVWERGFGRLAWADIERLHFQDRSFGRGFLVVDRTAAARARPRSRLQQIVARAARAEDLAIGLGGLQQPADRVAACIELAWRHANVPPRSQPSASQAASSGAVT